MNQKHRIEILFIFFTNLFALISGYINTMNILQSTQTPAIIVKDVNKEFDPLDPCSVEDMLVVVVVVSCCVGAVSVGGTVGSFTLNQFSMPLKLISCQFRFLFTAAVISATSLLVI